MKGAYCYLHIELGVYESFNPQKAIHLFGTYLIHFEHYIH